MSIKLIAATILTTTAVVFGLYMLQNNIETTSSEDLKAFHAFKQTYNKSYASITENNFRLTVFKTNMNLINDHQKDASASFTLAINEFADLTFDEFKSKYLMTNFKSMKMVTEDSCGSEMSATDNIKEGSAVDWEAENVVQKVKNQGQCGSCWAFSTIGSLESAYAINNKTLPDLSEQELVDCSKSYGNQGCNGGLMNLGFKYIIEHGIHTESEYSYRGVDGTCNAAKLPAAAHTAKDCVMVPANTDGLTAGLRRNPVSVAFYVSMMFQFYHGGVFDPYFCGGQPNHGVLAVGFDLDAKKPFYKVKNSWGSGWGEKGYFRIKIGTGKGTCDMAGSGASVYPVL